MTNIDRCPKSGSLAGQQDSPAADTPAGLAASLAEIRREALERVTDQLNGQTSAPDKPASLFGDLRRSVGKAVEERAETAGLPQILSRSLA